MSKNHNVSVGPLPVPIYPIQAFSPTPPGVKSEEVWRLIGPCVEYNIRKVPLWKVFVAVYIEGLQHGAALADGSDNERA